MKSLKKIASCAALALACAAAQAAPVNYDYFYTFDAASNGKITGTFTGDASGGLISNIGDVTGKIVGGFADGYVFHGLLGGSYDAGTGAVSLSGAVVSMDGQHGNFFFTNTTDLSSSSTTNWFYVVPNSGGALLEQARLDNDLYLDFDNRYYSAARFSVVAEAAGDPGVVPEPASMALLGLGLAGIGAMRRRQQK